MKNLFEALSKFQQECPVIGKETKGYGYKYASLPSIFETINPLLKKHGLALTQPLVQEYNKRCIKTILIHLSSGEKLESIVDVPVVTLKGMNDYQSLGSGITYLRRYSLSSLLGIVTDEDTDAQGKQESILADQQNEIEILLESATINDDEAENIRKSMKKFDADKAQKCIDYLLQHQIDAIQDGGNYSQKEINHKLDKVMKEEKK